MDVFVEGNGASGVKTDEKLDQSRGRTKKRKEWFAMYFVHFTDDLMQAMVDFRVVSWACRKR